MRARRVDVVHIFDIDFDREELRDAGPACFREVVRKGSVGIEQTVRDVVRLVILPQPGRRALASGDAPV